MLNESGEPATREKTLKTQMFAEPETAVAVLDEAPMLAGQARSGKVRQDLPIPAAPYLDRKVRDVPNLAEVWSYINPYMLYGRHLGFKGNFEKLLLERDPKALKLYHDLEEVKKDAARFMQVKAVWQFFEAERDGNSIHLFTPGAESPLHTFHFGRQPRTEGLCLSDYILEAEENRRDHLALFVVSAGPRVLEESAPPHQT